MNCTVECDVGRGIIGYGLTTPVRWKGGRKYIGNVNKRMLKK